MPQFAIHRAEKLTGWASLRRVGRHNHRLGEIPNADPEKRSMNELLTGTNDVQADVRAKITAAGLDLAKLRKNGVIAVELLFTASPEFFRPGDQGYGEYDQGRLDAWKRATLDHLAKRWGPDRIANAILHLDEATPHIQAVIVPIDTTPRKKGSSVRLNAARWLDGTPRLQALQDAYHEDVAHLGLERGLRGSKAKHRPVRRAYAEYAGEIAAAKELRIEAERDREAAVREREVATKHRLEAARELAEASAARDRALAAENASQATQTRAEGLVRGAQAIATGTILDGIQAPSGEKGFVWREGMSDSDKRVIKDWIGKEALGDVWDLARTVAGHIREAVTEAMAPVLLLVQRAEELRTRLDRKTRSEVDDLAIQIIKTGVHKPK